MPKAPDIQPPSCVCNPESGCDGEGYEPDDPRTCSYCLNLDAEAPCPADPSTYDSTIEWLMDALCESEKDDGPDDEGYWQRVVVCADGSEPFVSTDLGHGLVLDLTAKVRRVDG